MKKISYNTKTKAELTTELKSLKATIQAAVGSAQRAKNTNEYVVARKNVARVLTAMNALPKEALSETPSTEVEK
jgi:ribosomal protein L29